MAISKRDRRKAKRRNDQDYVNALRDWQEHQYSRGYFAGRVLPIGTPKPRQKRSTMAILIVMALLFIAMFILGVVGTRMAT